MSNTLGESVRGVVAALFFGGLLVTQTTAHAWSDEGHQVVGFIAERHLSPQVRVKVEALLAGDASNLTADRSLALETTWADRYRDSDRPTGPRYLQTRNWHFVNLPVGGPGNDQSLKSACSGLRALDPGTQASAGPAQACVVQKIEQFAAELKDTSLPPAERLRALQFLLHFVGDVHQPLHSADDHDAGGNNKQAMGNTFDSGALHHHWDETFVRMLGSDARQLAADLDAAISPAQVAQYAAGTPRDWAYEAFALAVRDAYGRLPAPSGVADKPLYRLSDAYVQQAVADVRLQLSRAGIRLASVLNAALGDPAMGVEAPSAANLLNDGRPHPRAVKVLIITLFEPETEHWVKNLQFTDNIEVPGLSRQYPLVRCTQDDICLATTGMGHTNAAASTMALMLSDRLDLRRAYLLVTGIAGINPEVSTIGSATWARYLVDFGLAHEFDVRDMPPGWQGGYFGIHTKGPDEKPQLAYGTEVFRLDEKLLQKALALSRGAALVDNDQARAYRLAYSQPAARSASSVLQCDTAAGDTYWHGRYLGEWATRWVGLLTDGQGRYCTTQQEDNAVYESIQRGAAIGRADAARVAVLRTGSNFDRPHEGQSAYNSLVESRSGGYPLAKENLFRAAWPLVQEIVSRWQDWATGVPD